MDGSRVCAGTYQGIYCKEQNQDSWRPIAPQVKYITDLAKTRNGWVVNSSSEGLLVSWDEGRSWTAPMGIGRFASSHGLHAYGDSLVSGASGLGNLFLSVDGGRNWDILANSLPGPLSQVHAFPNKPSYASRSIKFADGGSKAQMEPGTRSLPPPLPTRWPFPTAAYVCSIHPRALPVFGPSGLERKIRLSPGFELL